MGNFRRVSALDNFHIILQPRHVGLIMFQRFLQSRHLKFGVPFIGLLVGSSFALTNVTSFRYEFRKTKGLSEEELNVLKDQGLFKRDPNELTLENLYEEYMEKNEEKLGNYENLRIPRPWEDETKVDFMRQENRRLKSPRDIRRLQETAAKQA